MVIRIQRQAIYSAALDRAALLKLLLLAVVARFAQRLPVLLIPHEIFVALMGDLVVNHRSFDGKATRLAEHAERMMLEIRCPLTLPASAVASLGCFTAVATPARNLGSRHRFSKRRPASLQRLLAMQAATRRRSAPIAPTSCRTATSRHRAPSQWRASTRYERTRT